MEPFHLTIRVEDYDVVAERPDFLKQLRTLTLCPTSGMNYELDNFEQVRRQRPVNAHILTAYHEDSMIAWALLSKEPSDFSFWNTDGYHPSDGFLFEVYVSWSYRNKGVATQLFRAAKRIAKEETLCVCPHDEPSTKFYQNFLNCNNKHL